MGYTVTVTATAGTDYQPLNGSVIIAKGQQQTTIPVQPIADQLPEGTETIIAILQPGTDYKIGTPSQAEVKILDAPVPPKPTPKPETPKPKPDKPPYVIIVIGCCLLLLILLFLLS